MTALAFSIPGDIVPWQRALRSGSRTYNDPRVEAYKGKVRLHALAARQRVKRSGISWPLDGVYRVTVIVRRSDWKRMDADRALNVIADGCVKVLYEDDRHAFLRDARILIGSPSVACTSVIVEVVSAFEVDCDAEHLEKRAASLMALSSARSA